MSSEVVRLYHGRKTERACVLALGCSGRALEQFDNRGACALGGRAGEVHSWHGAADTAHHTPPHPIPPVTPQPPQPPKPPQPPHTPHTLVHPPRVQPQPHQGLSGGHGRRGPRPGGGGGRRHRRVRHVRRHRGPRGGWRRRHGYGGAWRRRRQCWRRGGGGRQHQVGLHLAEGCDDVVLRHLCGGGEQGACARRYVYCRYLKA